MFFFTLRYDTERSEFLWSAIRQGETDVETFTATPQEWDAKSKVVSKWLRSHTTASFSKWCKAAQQAAVALKVKFGPKVEVVTAGDLARIHRCKGGV